MFYRTCINWYSETIMWPNFKFWPNEVVQIDESALGRRWKLRMGLFRKPLWVLGAIGIASNKIWLKYIHRRTKLNVQPRLIPLFWHGQPIITDCHGCYRDISNFGVYHYTVNHKYGFVNEFNPAINTNTIEVYWRVMKDMFRKFHGMPTHLLQLHCNNFAFRHNSPKELLFWNILQAIAMYQNHNG